MIIISADQLKEEVQRAAKIIPKHADKAVSMAINEGVRKGKTAIWRAVKPVYNISQGDVYKRIRTYFSKPDRLVGTINISSEHLKMLLFSPKPTPTFKQAADDAAKQGKPKTVNLHRGKQVSVEIVKGKRTDIKGGFYAQMPKSGHRNIFVRRGKLRLPIHSMTTIGVAEMVQSQNVLPKITEEMKQVTVTELNRQINRFLKTP